MSELSTQGSVISSFRYCIRTILLKVAALSFPIPEEYVACRLENKIYTYAKVGTSCNNIFAAHCVSLVRAIGGKVMEFGNRTRRECFFGPDNGVEVNSLSASSCCMAVLPFWSTFTFPLLTKMQALSSHTLPIFCICCNHFQRQLYFTHHDRRRKNLSAFV